MTAVQAILRLGLAAQSLAIAGKSLELARKPKKTPKDFLATAFTSVAGTALLVPQARIIGTL